MPEKGKKVLVTAIQPICQRLVSQLGKKNGNIGQEPSTTRQAIYRVRTEFSQGPGTLWRIGTGQEPVALEPKSPGTYGKCGVGTRTGLGSARCVWFETMFFYHVQYNYQERLTPNECKHGSNLISLLKKNQVFTNTPPVFGCLLQVYHSLFNRKLYTTYSTVTNYLCYVCVNSMDYGIVLETRDIINNTYKTHGLTM